MAMNGKLIWGAFWIGLAAVVWAGVGFVGANWTALAVTVAIAVVYVAGAQELRRFRDATRSLATALAANAEPVGDPADWLAGIDTSLRDAVRARIDGARVALPGPALTPYLVGLLVMLGMLGTFLGMVVTFRGAVFALEGSADLTAMRAALAAPIRGLGFSFGASVAGVAASAMLGLMSALCRRERLLLARELDQRIATVLRPFSRAHRIDETARAMRTQAEALPRLVDRLEALAGQLDARSAQLDERLTQRQAEFQRELGGAFAGLADAVGRSLQDSLAAGARSAGDSLRPVLESAMNGIARSFDERSAALVAALADTASRANTEQVSAERERLEAWARVLETTGTGLRDGWARAGAQVLAQQQAVCETLERTAERVVSETREHAVVTLEAVQRLVARSEELVRARTASEEAWVVAHGARMDDLTARLREELGALRAEEATRGQAAVDRLDALQSAMSERLATLGAALEAPMTRLIETASESPRAAAQLIAQLREETARASERELEALEDRTALTARMDALLGGLEKTSREQRAAVEALVASAATMLERAQGGFAERVDAVQGRLDERLEAAQGRIEERLEAAQDRFDERIEAVQDRHAERLEAQSAQASTMADRIVAGAIEMSALAEAFQGAVERFGEANARLLEGLERVERAVSQSMTRSDEQMAYYVQQAREVVDLSLASQREIVEDLHRLQAARAAVPGASA
jgi:hypothetical protein